MKYIILQHLPVFLQKTMAGETDSQLVNSVYLDNTQMELYHGRLDKTAGAIALRYRWYGTGTPEIVFVERKTHRESWAGELSVKERFITHERKILSLLNGTFNVDDELSKLRAKGKGEDEIKDWHALVQEVVQAINSKQLIPTMRSQYMRTAFQIPFDASVRISLDTNLCMITERTKEQLNGERWYRNPSVPVPENEITRFPHAVLEIKLQLQADQKTPAWVSDLLESGMLMEVHKFSKFIHGCAVLLPDEIRSVPYWIDDASLAESIKRAGAAGLIENSIESNHFNHLIPHDKGGQRKPLPARRHEIASTNNNWSSYQQDVGLIDENGEPVGAFVGMENECVSQWCEWAQAIEADHMTTQKVISWHLHSSISSTHLLFPDG